MDFKAIFIELFTFKTYIIFLAGSLVISISLNYLLPFPLGLVAMLGIFIGFPLLIRRRAMSRMGGYGESGTGGGFFGRDSGRSAKVHYVCLVCNNKHNGGSCPRCGSKMQRADF